MSTIDERLQELKVAAREALEQLTSAGDATARAREAMQAVATEAQAISDIDHFYPALAYCQARDRWAELADELEAAIHTDGSAAAIADELLDAVELLELGASQAQRFHAKDPEPWADTPEPGGEAHPRLTVLRNGGDDAS